jgi:hypothetical protein
MLAAHMAEANYLRALAKLREGASESMFKIKPGDSHGHARLVGIREGLDQAEAAFRAAAQRDDEDVLT